MLFLSRYHIFQALTGLVLRGALIDAATKFVWL